MMGFHHPHHFEEGVNEAYMGTGLLQINSVLSVITWLLIAAFLVAAIRYLWILGDKKGGKK